MRPENFVFVRGEICFVRRRRTQKKDDTHSYLFKRLLQSCFNLKPPGASGTGEILVSLKGKGIGKRAGVIRT